MLPRSQVVRPGQVGGNPGWWSRLSVGVRGHLEGTSPWWKTRLDTHCSDELDDESEAGRSRKMQRLEAVLFLSREPLNTRKLSQFARLVDATEARTLVRRLNNLYDDEDRAFRIERVAGGYQMLTRPQFGTWLRRLEHVPNETRLSPPALETLAVIAYRQPVLRAEIEGIRGVSCGEIVRQLMERDLVRIAGRSEELGRPYLYGTTRKFLQLFGVPSLDKLPRADMLRKLTAPDKESEAPVHPLDVAE